MIASAFQIDLKDGSRIWVPPTGRPFWAHIANGDELTDEEMRKHGIPGEAHASLSEALERQEAAK